MHEVEDAMFSGFESGNETRPGDRTLGRRAGAETRKVTACAELFQIWKCVPVTFHEGGIHPIYAEDDEPGNTRGAMTRGEAGKERENENEAGDYCWPPR